MELLGNLFNTILYQPLLNALVFLYVFLPGRDFGAAVILLTILLRLVLYPLMAKSIKSQKALSEIQPKIREIQQKFKEDKGKQAKEMMALYRKEKINPFGSFLPLLIQLPILFALYRVFWKGLNPGEMTNLYGFVPQPEIIDPTFFGVINLAGPSAALAFLAGISQFFQTKMVIPKTSKTQERNNPTAQFSKLMQKQMLYFFPIFTVFFLWKLPAALALYWIITSLFSILQQYLIFKKTTLITEKNDPRKF